MKSLSFDEYQQLVAASEVLEQDGHGIKVLKTRDGLIVKLFRRKRVLSSAVFKPYAARFVDNTHTLESLGIKTVSIEAVYRCAPINRTLIVYRPVPGQTLRKALRIAADPGKFMAQFAGFFAELHEKGVLFRSIHLNNIIVPEAEDTFGLIDIADMKIFKGGLSLAQRMRNLRHLMRYQEDRKSINAFGIEKFADIYCGNCKEAGLHKNDFLVKMQGMIDTDDSL